MTTSAAAPDPKMNPQHFMALGQGHCAYVRAVEEEGERLYAIYGADGVRLGVCDNFDAACAAIRISGMARQGLH